jgi:hypothetical protein
VADAFCMEECAEAMRAADEAQGFAHLECVPVSVGGRECVVAISGPGAGNCYSINTTTGTSSREYLYAAVCCRMLPYADVC